MPISTYRRNLRAAVRGLWSGAISVSQFNSVMKADMDRNLTQAWDEGAKECGIKPDEYSDAENLALAEAILKEQGFVEGFAADVQANSKANKGKLTPLFGRLEMWVNRYNDIKNQAKAMVCGDLKYRWQLGPTEHCVDCAKLSGRVYRGSIWQKYGILPQSHDLACGGWRCQCSLVQTDEPVTKGRPPALRGRRKKMMIMEAV